MFADVAFRWAGDVARLWMRLECLSTFHFFVSLSQYNSQINISIYKNRRAMTNESDWNSQLRPQRTDFVYTLFFLPKNIWRRSHVIFFLSRRFQEKKHLLYIFEAICLLVVWLNDIESGRKWMNRTNGLITINIVIWVNELDEGSFEMDYESVFFYRWYLNDRFKAEISCCCW